MDCKDRIITFIGSIYPFLTETYLLTLANKGIYNRAGKDLEKCKASIALVLEEEQQALKVQLEEGLCVHLKAPIQESQCTCPSQSLCRHIMTALLYCKAYYEEHQQSGATATDIATDTDTDKVTHSEVDLPELEALSDETIAKSFGKKLYNQALMKIEHMGEIRFDYGAFVTVTLGDKFTIYFTKENTLDQAVCSCKEKGLCEHKLYVLIAYLQREKKRKLYPIEEHFQWGEEEAHCCKLLKQEISLLVDKGLASLTERSINKVEKLYIKAYGCKFYELASDLKSLSGELIYYFSRNVAFSNKRTMHLLCRIYNRLLAMEAQNQDQVKLKYLLGQLRQEGLELDELQLVGLGARCFMSRRQDLVITGYFYCQEVGRIVTMSTLRPLETRYDAQGGNPINRKIQKAVEYLYSAPLAWEQELPFESIKSAKVVLEKGVLKEGKLSTTKKSSGKIVGETTLEDILPFAVKHYNELKEKLKAQKQDYFEAYASRQNTYVIIPKDISAMSYNKVTQRLEFTVYDQRGEAIFFYLPYNAITDAGIRALEQGKNQAYKVILGNVFVKGNQLEAELLCLFHQEEEKCQWKI